MAGKKGRSGRRASPSDWKLFMGTYREDRDPVAKAAANPTALPVPDGVAECPAHLDATARAMWAQVAPVLAKLNLLTSIDAQAFANICDAWSRIVWATKYMRRRPRVVKTPNGMLQIHPVETYKRQAIEDFVKIADRFGMTPHARQQVADVILGGRFSHPTPQSPASTSSESGAPSEQLGPRPVTDRLGRPC